MILISICTWLLFDPETPFQYSTQRGLWLKAIDHMAFSTQLFVTLSVLSLLACSTSAQLSPDFYDKTCPNLHTIVLNTMRQAVNKEARIGASILRLFFHDCFVNVRHNLLLLLYTENNIFVLCSYRNLLSLLLLWDLKSQYLYIYSNLASLHDYWIYSKLI